jgi:hypothetical protein
MKFRGVGDIQKYYQSKLNNGNKNVLNEIKTKNGQSFEVVTDTMLITEAERLRKCIQTRIEEYYSTYPESVYPEMARTNGLRNALKVEKSVRNDGDKKYVGLYFEDSESWGRSFVTHEWNGFKPYLINEGWTVRQPVLFKNTRAGHQDGFHFIEKGIEDWRKDLKNPVEVKRIGNPGSFDIANKI